MDAHREADAPSRPFFGPGCEEAMQQIDGARLMAETAVARCQIGYPANIARPMSIR